MTIPKAVLAQGEEAKRLFEAQGSETEKEVELDIDPELLKKDEDDNVPVIDPDNLDNVQNLDKLDKDEPAKIIKPAPEKDEVAEEIKTLTAMNKKLDNENRSLKIKRNDYERTISDLKAEAVNLKAEVVNLKADLIKTKEAPATDPVSQKFSKEEREMFLSEGFSDELINIFEKKGIQPAPQVDDSRVQKLEEELTTVKNETAQEKLARFWNELDQAAPQWDALNEDPGFVQHLSTFPEFSNKSLGQIMKDAQDQLDVPTIAKIFNDYSKINNGNAGQEDPNKKDENLNAENNQAKKDNPTLADLATPKSSNAAPPDAKPGKWTPKQIAKFYEDVARNPLKYTPEAVVKIEKAYIHR